MGRYTLQGSIARTFGKSQLFDNLKHISYGQRYLHLSRRLWQSDSSLNCKLSVESPKNLEQKTHDIVAGNKQKNMPIKVLNVAEKNDAAKSIAELLSRGGYTRKEGFSVFNKIYQFRYEVQGQFCDMFMTSGKY